MIDTHCHMENEAYQDDREIVIESLKDELEGVVSVGTHPDHFDLVLGLAEEYQGFLHPVLGVHPIHVKEFTDNEIENVIEIIRENSDKIVGTGEHGLDYFHDKDKSLRERQKKLFKRFISLAEELDKPLVVHSRDAGKDTVQILEEAGYSKVHFHLFGYTQHIQNVLDNQWMISIGPLVTKSKDHKRIARDVPLEQIMLETDSPWFGDTWPGTPVNIKKAAEKIGEIKNLSFEEVWKQCGENAKKFYNI